MFSPDEHDLIVELMNLGVGRAASALSQLIGDEVLLSVPAVDFIPLSEAQDSFHSQLPECLAGVLQNFNGFVSGRAVLLFPEERSFELLEAMLGVEAGEFDQSELELEALTELGNILLNNCLATISNQLGESLQTDIPEAFTTNSSDLSTRLNLFDQSFTEASILLVNIDFSLKDKALQGHLIFLVDLSSKEPFLKSLQRYIGGLLD